MIFQNLNSNKFFLWKRDLICARKVANYKAPFDEFQQAVASSARKDGVQFLSGVSNFINLFLSLCIYILVLVQFAAIFGSRSAMCLIALKLSL